MQRPSPVMLFVYITCLCLILQICQHPQLGMRSCGAEAVNLLCYCLYHVFMSYIAGMPAPSVGYEVMGCRGHHFISQGCSGIPIRTTTQPKYGRYIMASLITLPKVAETSKKIQAYSSISIGLLSYSKLHL